jgi:hypothetical protein
MVSHKPGTTLVDRFKRLPFGVRFTLVIAFVLCVIFVRHALQPTVGY